MPNDHAAILNQPRATAMMLWLRIISFHLSSPNCLSMSLLLSVCLCVRSCRFFCRFIVLKRLKQQEEEKETSCPGTTIGSIDRWSFLFVSHRAQDKWCWITRVRSGRSLPTYLIDQIQPFPAWLNCVGIGQDLSQFFLLARTTYPVDPFDMA